MAVEKVKQLLQISWYMFLIVILLYLIVSIICLLIDRLKTRYNENKLIDKLMEEIETDKILEKIDNEDEEE